MQPNTDKEKATVRQKAPDNPNMKTDTQADTQRLAKAIYGEDSPEYKSTKASAPETRMCTHPEDDICSMCLPRTRAHSSALPWFTVASPKPDELHPMVSIWSGTETRESIVCNSCTPADAKLIVASVNQADKLAEALSRFTEAYRMQSDHDLECAEAEASKALAEYEAAQ